jgi:hypothetical protein
MCLFIKKFKIQGKITKVIFILTSTPEGRRGRLRRRRRRRRRIFILSFCINKHLMMIGLSKHVVFKKINTGCVRRKA